MHRVQCTGAWRGSLQSPGKVVFPGRLREDQGRKANLDRKVWKKLSHWENERKKIDETLGVKQSLAEIHPY